MKHSKSALKFLLAEYRAIFKRAYFKGLTTSVAFAALTASASVAQAQDSSFSSQITPSEQSVSTLSAGAIDPRETPALDESGNLVVSEDKTFDAAPEEGDINNIIISGSSTTATISGADLTASGSLTAEGNLAISGDGTNGSLAISGDATFNGDVTLTSGSFSSESSVTVGSGTLAIGADSNFEVGSSLTLTGTTVTNSGDVTAKSLTVSGGSLTTSVGGISVTSSALFQDGVEFNLSGDTAVSFEAGGGLTLSGDGNKINVGTSGSLTANVDGLVVTGNQNDVIASGADAAISVTEINVTGDEFKLHALSVGTVTSSGNITISGSSAEIKAGGEGAAVSGTKISVTGDNFTVSATDGGAVNASKPIELTGNSGTVTVGGSAASTISGSAITIAGDNNTITVNASGTLSATGAISISGANTIDVKASGTVSASKFEVLGDGANVTISGTLESTGAINISGTNISGSFASGSTVSGTSLTLAGEGSKLTIDSDATATLGDITVSDSATLNLGADSSDTANITINSGASLNLTDDITFSALEALNVTSGNFTNSGAADLSGAAVTLTDATFNNSGTLTTTGAFSGTNSTITLATSATLTAEGITLSGGSLDASAAISAGEAGAFTATDTDITLNSDGTLTAAGGITLSGGSLNASAEISGGDAGAFTSTDTDITLNTGGTLSASGATVTGGSLNASAAIDAGSGSFTASDANITLNTDGTLTASGASFAGGKLDASADIDAGSGSFAATGTNITLKGASISGASATFTDANTTVESGTISIANTTISGGSFSVATGAEVTFGGEDGGIAVNGGTFTNAGTITVTSGAAVSGSAKFINNGNATVSSGDFTVDASSSFTNSGSLTLNDSTDHAVSGSFDNAGGTVDLGTGTLTFNNDVTLNGTFTSGSLVVAAGKTATVSSDDFKTTVLGTDVVFGFGDTSTKLVINGDADLSSLFSDEGTLSEDKVSGSGVINVSGTATLGTAYNIAAASGALSATSFVTSGDFELTDGALSFTENFNNSGTVTVSGGSLTFNGVDGTDGSINSVTVSGGAFNVDSGKLVVASGETIDVQSGSLNIGQNKAAYLDVTSGSMTVAASSSDEGEDNAVLAVKAGSLVNIGGLGSLAVKASDVLSYDEATRAKVWAASDSFGISSISGAAGSVVFLKDVASLKGEEAFLADDMKAIIDLFSSTGVKVDFGDVTVEGLVPGAEVSYGLGYDKTLGSCSTVYRDNNVKTSTGAVSEDAYWGAAIVGEGVDGITTSNNISLVNTEYNGGLFVKKEDGTAGSITQSATDKVVDLRGSGEVGDISSSGSVILSNKVNADGSTTVADITTGAIVANQGATVSGVNANITSIDASSGGTVSISDTSGTIGAITSSGDVTFDNASATFTGDVASNSGDIVISDSSAAFSGAVSAASGSFSLTNSSATFSGAVSASGAVTISGGSSTFADVTSSAGDISISGTSGSTFGTLTTETASKNINIADTTNNTFTALSAASGTVSVTNSNAINLGDVTTKSVSFTGSDITANSLNLSDSGSTINGGTFNLTTVSGSSSSDVAQLTISNDASGSISDLTLTSGSVVVNGSTAAGADNKFVTIGSLTGATKVESTNSLVFVDSLASTTEIVAHKGGLVAVNSFSDAATPSAYSASARAAGSGLTISKSLNVSGGGAVALGFAEGDLATLQGGIKKLLGGTASGSVVVAAEEGAPASRESTATTFKASSVLAINQPVTVGSGVSVKVGTSSSTSGTITLGNSAVLAVTKDAYQAASESNPLITGTNANGAVVTVESGATARIAVDDLTITREGLEAVIKNTATGAGAKALEDSILVTDASGLFVVQDVTPPDNGGGNGGGGVVIPPYDPPTDGGNDNNSGNDNNAGNQTPSDPFADFLRMHTSRGVYNYIAEIYYGGNLSSLAGTVGGKYITTQVSNGMNPENVEATARLSAAAGTAQSIYVGQSALTDAIAERNGIGANAPTLANNGMGGALWVTPTYTNFNSSGFSAERVSYGTDISLSSITLGADYTIADNTRLGAAFNVGTGSTDGKGFASSVSSDLSYYGFSLYGAYNFNALTVLGDITYSSLSNDVTQNAYETQLTTDNDATALSLGVVAKYEIDMGNGYSVAPHAGLRYTNLDIDNFDAKAGNEVIAHGTVDKQSVVSIPVGVTFAGDLSQGSWSVRPNIDLTLTANTGDTDQKVNTTFTGLDSMDLSTDTFDSFTYGVKAGIDASSGNLKFGVKVGYTGSSNANQLGVNANVTFAF